MPEKIALLEDLQIYRIDSYGDVSIEDMKQSLAQLVEMQRESGLRRVLVDATKETSLPPAGPLYEFGSELAKTVAHLTFAIAVAPGLARDLGFIETVTRNRGMQVRVFDSVDAALAWLNDQPTS